MTSLAYAYEPDHAPVEVPSTDDFVDELFAAPRHLRLVTDVPAGPAPVTAAPAYQPSVSTGSQLSAIALRVVALAVAVVAVFFLIASPSVDAETVAPTTIDYVVQPGDTLWDLAADATVPGADVRQTIQFIKDANGLSGSMLVAGELIQIPQAG